MPDSIIGQGSLRTAWRIRVRRRGLERVLELVKELELVGRTEVEGVVPDGELELALAGEGQLVAEGVELGDKELVGDAGEESGDEGLEGEEGLDGIVAAAMEGLDSEAEVVGELVGVVEDGLGEDAEFVGSESMGVVAGAKGIEVAGWSARATGAELGIAVGAAVGVTAHGPGMAAGDLAVGFVRIAGHGFEFLSIDPIIARIFGSASSGQKF